MVGTRSTAREPLEEPSSITESPRPIVTSGGTQDETLHDTAAALPPGGTSAPVAPVTTASNGSHATTTAGVPQPNDTSQPLRDLTAALLEVVRGVRPAPATHRCLGKRTWNHRCKGKKCEAQGCEYYHHKLLHDDAAQPMKSDNGVAAPRQRTQSNRAGGQATVFESCSNATTAAAGALRSVQTYLKVLPVQLSGPHGEIDTYALLDDGSTITLLTSSLADKIGVAGPAAPFVIEAIAGAHIDAVSSQRVKFSIKGKYTNNKINIEARTIDSLNISPQSVPTEALAHCEHLQDISDQLVYATAEPLILIGQDNWSLLIASEVRRGKLEQPVASHTPLGWVLHGQKRVCPYGRGGYMLQERFHCSHAHMKDEALEQLIKEHYDLESLGVEPRRPQADPEHQEEFPEAVDPIINNHYMDDYLQSFDTAAEANRVAQAVDAVHRRGNFVLQKWASNDSNAIAGLAVEPMTPNVNINEEEKILGLVWRIADDTLGFNLSKFSFNNSITKRQLLKEVMSLYDPLGLVTPITIQGKQILQEAWRSNVGWDDPLPFKLEQVWQTWLISLQGLKDVALPRCYPLFSSAETLELHVFVDASEVAYAAAAYWRSVNDKGEVQVSLAAAKARVAPIKIVSIPRLELQAAVLGSRLAHAVGLHHSRRPDRRVLWTDSRTVLSWLRAGSRSFKPFVAHRVAELEETTTTSEWRWVPTADNVADDATRRVQTDFTAAHRWFRGPEFLYKEEKLWPHDKDPLHSTETGEERVAATTIRPQLKDALPDVSRFSSWIHLIRSTARILQFIDRCKTHTVTAMRRKRTRCTPSEDPDWTGVQPRSSRAIARTTPQRNHSNASASRTYVPLAAFYTRRAELIWTRALQEDCFSSELRDITGGRRLSTDSRLRHLSLTTDQNGVMRLRSRTAAATDINEETLSPAVLDGDHAYSRLYINWIHRKLHHSGVECVTNEIRQRFWMLRIRPTVRAVIRRCQPCRLRRATPPEPLTGNLPPCRLTHHQRPFTQTGLDYFGPLSVTIARHHEKRYVALFTCLTTRAVHLEIASSLSADAAVLALRRMMARRGCPDTVWSDNGSNFHGADAELRKAALTSMKQEADIRQINWHYIPPGAPFMGGAWERLVRSVKTALTATLHERHPHEDVLHTLLTEVEHTINSRPLSHVSVAPEDDTALTPNHFLLGGPSKVPLPGAFTKVDELGRSHWKAAQRLADLFWQRWVREVLPLLHHRREPHGHGEAVKVGDVVVIVDSTLPRNVWPKGRVEQVYPGADGVIRVVDVKTKNGLMRRPTKRLVILPVEC
ncbi:uncharacterized protein LOC128674842 [Plodia interpunctella]|uniref:uncharacterized protein LOC128674842 n=1 Tax=Plodia interpunctella TaxID=58824 RepID=UPI002368ED62|nr:uncharacterized protein LOC128674842 [Plodia interpunctella]